MASGSPAQPPNLLDLTSALTDDQEPITPILQAPAADPLKLALGERLFVDRRLSHDGMPACSSCHDLHTNGATDGRRRKARNGSALPFTTPTVFNAALRFRLNWKGIFELLRPKPSPRWKTLRTWRPVSMRSLKAGCRSATRSIQDALWARPGQPACWMQLRPGERSVADPGSRFLERPAWRRYQGTCPGRGAGRLRTPERLAKAPPSGYERRWHPMSDTAYFVRSASPHSQILRRTKPAKCRNDGSLLPRRQPTWRTRCARWEPRSLTERCLTQQVTAIVASANAVTGTPRCLLLRCRHEADTRRYGRSSIPSCCSPGCRCTRLTQLMQNASI